MEFLIWEALRIAKLALNRANENAASIGTLLSNLVIIQGGGGVIGVDGSSAVFKNGNFWLRDQNGLYHLASCYVQDGQVGVELQNTGYAYASIP